jgi:hypothetical protein
MSDPAGVAEALDGQPLCLNCLAEKLNLGLSTATEALIAVRVAVVIKAENSTCPVCRRPKIVFSIER